MVVSFKMRSGSQRVYPVTLDKVETMLGRNPPWFVVQQSPLTSYHVAVCPYCDNPVRLKGLHKRIERSPRPYGEHVGKPVYGFNFDAAAHQYCPYVLRKTSNKPTDRRGFDPLAEKLIDLAVSEFDRIVLILRDDYGFWISDALALRMLKVWFADQGYLYTGAHLRNLPWMVGYFAASEKLFGQPIGRKQDLADAITAQVKTAEFDRGGRLQAKRAWVDLRMQTLKHRSIVQDDHSLKETTDVRVQDYTGGNNPDRAKEVFRFTITFRPDRFEALINTPTHHAKRNQKLLDEARKIANEYVC